jgi:GNAT superfamily N-acetyltransferase
MDDQQLLQSFEDRTLPFDQWTHRCHVKVAYLYLRKYGFDEALRRIAKSIKAFNAANNRPEGPLAGYNQTTTHATLHLIFSTMQAYEKTHPVKSADEFCDAHPELLSKNILRFFYSPHRRMHSLAKLQFIEPDLAPLPKFVAGKDPIDWLMIRPARLTDAPAIARIHADTWRTTYRSIVPDDYLDNIDSVFKVSIYEKRLAEPGAFYFVAEYEKAGIVGFLNGGPTRSPNLPFQAELYAIYVLATHQNKRIGSLLTEALVHGLRDASMNSLLVWVLTDNPYRRFYEKLGGRQVAKKLETVGGKSLEETAFAWDDLCKLSAYSVE